VDGRHYARTSEAWLANLDARRGEARRALAESSGEESADLRLRRWRVFFMACAELFAWENGSEWLVAHYRLAPRAEAAR
jgi:cyclopropane-fatty-acyl-phospholipid synthase